MTNLAFVFFSAYTLFITAFSAYRLYQGDAAWIVLLSWLAAALFGFAISRVLAWDDKRKRKAR
uniref:Uncharacterized protein n=1 Tax=Pseudomonas fluorescens (strain SBW25) TaxID=216595 RepID=A0A0G4E5G5_PSEFS|nr:hypothetical protein PQBR57_0310 [Pseudomonas fluorescens SBW25]